MGPDRFILHFLTTHRQPAMTSVATFVMNAGSSRLVLGLVALIGLAAVIATRWWEAGLAAAGALVSSTLAAEGLKRLIARPRPPASLALVQLRGWSMPSTQAALTMALAIALLLALPWGRPRARGRAAALLAAGVVSIGFLMLYLGGHWPSDVLAGWVLGAGLGLGSVRLAGMLTGKLQING